MKLLLDRGKEGGKRLHTSHIQVPARGSGFASGIPPGHIRIVVQWESGYLERRYGGGQRQVSDSQIIARRVFQAFEGGLEETDALL